jgi:hypothetical protein
MAHPDDRQQRVVREDDLIAYGSVGMGIGVRVGVPAMAVAVATMSAWVSDMVALPNQRTIETQVRPGFIMMGAPLPYMICSALPGFSSCRRQKP